MCLQVTKFSGQLNLTIIQALSFKHKAKLTNYNLFE
jgi:hypothetical protein